MQTVEKNSVVKVPLIIYSGISESAGISYVERPQCLEVGQIPEKVPWIIYLSSRILQGVFLLEEVLPVIKDMAVPFRVLKDNYMLNKSNGFRFGLDAVGKFIQFLPSTEREAVNLVNALQPISERYAGPAVSKALRLGKIIYAIADKDQSYKHSPFKIPSSYRPHKKKKILGKYFIPIQVMRSLPKGDTIKAINFRKLKLSWCLIKQGRIDATDDFFDRDMVNRIQWQYDVLSALSDLSTVPKVFDIFSDSEASYLAIEYIEGVTLRQRIQELSQGKSWEHISSKDRGTILNYFLQAICVVQSVHYSGFIHRDINDENFIVTPNGELCLIDFELAWSEKRKFPSPPFGHGTFGYMSPQQIRFATPTASDDVYSLGAILVYLLSGKHPRTFLENVDCKIFQVLETYTNNVSLRQLCEKCLAQHPMERPTLTNIKEIISLQLQLLLNLEVAQNI